MNKSASTQWQQGQKDDPGPSHHGRTAQIHPDPEHPLGFRVNDLPLPPAADGDVEAALATHAPLAVADLRAARPSIGDAESFQRMRMGGYFIDVPVFDAGTRSQLVTPPHPLAAPVTQAEASDRWAAGGLEDGPRHRQDGQDARPGAATARTGPAA